MTEIYINGQIVDIDKDIAMSLNYSIADILSPEKRNTSFSKTIKLPGTKTNNNLFSHIFEISKEIDSDDLSNFTIDYNPNLKADCKIFQENILQFNGMLQLKQINRINENIEYEVVVFGNLRNLITEFDKKNIENIDISKYDHELNYTNFKNSWATSIIKDGIAYNNFLTGNPKGEGYVYITADYGYTQSPVAMNLINCYPAVYVREILETMFREVGFTWTSTFLDSVFFKRLVIPFNKREIILSNAEKLNRNFRTSRVANAKLTFSLPAPARTTQYPVLVLNGNDLVYDPATNAYKHPATVGGSPVTINHFPLFDNDSTGANFDTTDQYSIKTFTGAYNPDGSPIMSGTNEFTAKNTGYYDFTANVALLLEATQLSTFTVSVSIARHSIYTGNQVIANYNATLAGITSTTVSADILAKSAYVQEGDKVLLTIYVQAVYLGGTTGVTGAVTINAGSQFYTNAVTMPIQVGDTVTMSSLLPKNVPQREFFLSLVKMFNLYVEPDPVSETNLIIAPLVDFYAAEEVVNWSRKVDGSKPAIIKPISELEGKDYKFKYKKDVDFYNADYLLTTGKEYGERNLSIVNDFLKGEKKFEIIFSPTPSFGILDNEMVIPRFVKENADTGAVEPIDTNIRILYYGGVLSAGGSWSVNDGTTVYTETNYAYAGHLDHPFTPTLDLLFDMPDLLYWGAPSNIGSSYTNNNLYNKYYSQFIEEITDKNSKVVELTIQLDPSDFAILDFKKLIHIDGINYRLNQIKDYNPTNNAPCKVVLSKIKKGIPFEPIELKNKGTRQAVERFGLLDGMQDRTRRGGSIGKIKRVDGTKDDVFFGETTDVNDIAGIDKINGGRI